MAGFQLHPEALLDLEEVWEYIAGDNVDSADRVIAEIFEAFHSLPPFPKQGHRRPDLTNLPLRFKVVREYLIAYAPELKPVSILAVIHGRRSPRVLAAILRERTG